jgi:NAD(P)-dependent dehydrogenase (short-subunit alcohol dehydrogenase family)
MSTQSPPGGSIIGISSISALVGGSQQAHYTPTKAGVLSLMQSCACALGKYNIRCNALLPGTIKTQLNDKDLEVEEKRKYMEGRIPLGRIGAPKDLAGPAVFLGCEELSGYVVSLAPCSSFGYDADIAGLDWSTVIGRWGSVRQFAIVNDFAMLRNNPHSTSPFSFRWLCEHARFISRH